MTQPEAGADRGTLERSFPWLLLFLGAGCTLLFLYRTWSFPLTDPDEGRYAEIAREMAVEGDWLVPKLFGIPYLEKPPLLYWLTATCFQLFGPSELAARLVPALSATVGVLAVGWFARALLGWRAGLLSSAVLAISAMYLVLARTLLADMLFSTSLSLSLLAAFSAREQGPRGARIVVFWIALAAATLSKGPAAIVLVGLVLAADALSGGGAALLRRPAVWAGALLFTAAVLPWFLWVEGRFPGYLSFYLFKEHLHRAAGAEHSEPFYWFVPWLLGGLFPWTPLAIAAAPGWWRKARDPSLEGRLVRFLSIWAGVVFVVFSLAVGKLATYILPMFPPLAILIGHSLDRWLAGDEGAIPERSLRRANGTLAMVMFAGAVVIVIAHTLVADVAPAAMAFALAALLAGGAAALLRWRGEHGLRPLATIAMVAAGLYILLAGFAPALGDSLTARPHIRRIQSDAGPADAVAFYGGYFPSTAFYTGRRPHLVGTRPELRFGKSLVAAEESEFLLAEPKRLATVAPGARLYILTDTRKKRLRELTEAAGPVEELARNRVSVLWLRR